MLKNIIKDIITDTSITSPHVFYNVFNSKIYVPKCIENEEK